MRAQNKKNVCIRNTYLKHKDQSRKTFRKDYTTSSSNKQTKALYRGYFKLYCKLLCHCFKYLLKRNHFGWHWMSKRNFEVHMKHLNSTQCTGDEICLCLQNFPELWNYFLNFPWEIVFVVISGNCFYLQLLENAKRSVI